MDEYILKVQGIEKSFAGVHALQGVDLEIRKGEIHCLAGENGCGKSTLIKIISGVYERDAGSLEIEGKSYPKITPIQAIASGVQVIYQDLSIFPNLTVMENLAYNTIIAEKKVFANWKRFRKLAQEACNRIGWKVDLDAIVADLPIAHKQMIAISRALLNNAKLIIMDEPTTSLTKKEVKNLFSIIKNLQEQGISILFVSHKLDEVFEISDRFTILRNGKNVFTGDTDELNNESFSYYMTGRHISEEPYIAKTQTEFPLMRVKDISLKNCFTDVSFDLYGGEILGISGLLGSGRTELALALFGYYKVDKGSITVYGEQERKIDSIESAMAAEIGYVPEDRLTEGLFLPRGIGKNITISKISEFANKLLFIDREKEKKDIQRWVERLAIATPDPSNAVATLSGGNQQRVAIAKWLARHPKILILNGPTVGVDIGSKYDLHLILKELADNGMGIIIISDDLQEVSVLCNKVMIMDAGKISMKYDVGNTDISKLIDKMTSSRTN